MNLYNAVRAVPQEAKKQITGGRLKGMTDINPMWRIKSLTEQFGPCGTGWKYVIKDKILEHGANGEIAAFVDIDLYYKDGEQWSDPVPGTGGSMFVSKERSGMYTSDECFKMALTDAISVACKALGFGADVYWESDRSKYTGLQQPKIICESCGKEVTQIHHNGKLYPAEYIAKSTKKTYGKCLCWSCSEKLKEDKNHD